DLDMNNGHASGTRVIEDACGTSQEGVLVVFGVDGNDAGLAIHAQDGGVSRIDRKYSGQIAPRAAEGFLPDSILIQRDPKTIGGRQYSCHNLTASYNEPSAFESYP